MLDMNKDKVGNLSCFNEDGNEKLFEIKGIIS